MRLKCLLEFVSQEALTLGIDRIQNLDEFHKNLQKRALRVEPKESFIDLLHTNTSKILTFTKPLHVYGSFLFVFKNCKTLLVASRVLYVFER